MARRERVPGSVAVEVTQSETVVERGTRAVVWFVKSSDAWLNAGEYPGARVERRDPGPGTIWESSVELDLPPGTRLMRVETRPAKDSADDALDYLLKETRRARRRTERSYFRVGRSGALVREDRAGARRS